MYRDFRQAGPRLGNQYEEDSVLRGILRRYMPTNVLQHVETDLTPFGQRCMSELWPLSIEAESQPPHVQHFDPWGNRVDRVCTSRAWQRFHDISAEEGIVAIGYERRSGEFSRLHQMAKLYLFTPSSAIYSCPLAMTDGAAALLETCPNEQLRRDAFPHLTTRDASQFWTSGQWMTETTGGSDVSRTSTVYDPASGTVSGFKWFTSATDADMAMALAREGDNMSKISLFYLSLRNDRNKMIVHRLKEKLGTKALPTAEVTLDKVPAVRIGAPGAGVRQIAKMINVTRLYNAVSSVSLARRVLAAARDYAHRRVAFGKPLSEQPLHLRTLARLETEFRGCMQMVFYEAWLFGRVETLGDAHAEQVLRVLTPIVKLYTGRRCFAIVSECVECFGGAGYMEDTQIARFLRDSQVLTIWEGTTNVLALDLLRALKSVPFVKVVSHWQQQAAAGEAFMHAEEWLTWMRTLEAMTVWWSQGVRESDARDFAYSLAHVAAIALLIGQYASSKDPLDLDAIHAWMDVKRIECADGLLIVVTSTRNDNTDERDRRLALDIGSDEGKPRGCGDGSLRCKL